jgi:hypothetical protein
MTGPEHYQRAEELLGRAFPPGQDYISNPDLERLAIGHALLAVAAAAALGTSGTFTARDRDDWAEVAAQPNPVRRGSRW